MVSTRRGRSKAAEEAESSSKDDETPDEEIVASPEKNTKSTPPAKSSSSKKKKSKSKQKNEELKLKNTGTGLKISIDTPSTNKKITFDDDDFLPNVDEVDDDAADNDQEGEEATPSQPDLDNENEDADDDDAVEEVQGGFAREKILEQLKLEEEGALKSKTKKKRKERKEKKKEDEDDEDEFDDGFFAELEKARAVEATKNAAKVQAQGLHTTFVVQQEAEELADATPKVVDGNIQVVVLKNRDSDDASNAITAVPTNALSEEALLYSRGRLVNGKDKPSTPAVPGRRVKKRKRDDDPTWKRSRKMNLLSMGRSRFRGVPAANFAKKR